MKRISILFLLLLSSFFARATHIVGGELELVHLSNDTYRVGLIMYFDAVFGNPAAIDNNVTVHIYSKTTNSLIESITLPLRSDELVNYTQPDCAIGNLVTRKIYYWRTLVFNRNLYGEPNGYYMVWERCCRNGVIDNIVAPGEAGQTFYLEFPPMRTGTQPFNNSSPALFPPLSDYACVNQPFFFDFSGSDSDGDQLRYRLVTPLNGYSTSAEPLPGAHSGPYPTVTFVPGIGVTNMVPGAPPMSITNEGIIYMTPTQPGLYVFAVACDEYRNGVKIGEVRREFQMLVLDCPSANAPNVNLQPNNSSSLYNEGDILEYIVTDEKCGQILITDIDPNTIINAHVEPLNFTDANLLLQTTGTINGAGDQLALNICFPDCPNPSGDPYIFNVIVGDNSCSIPLYDTIQVKVQVNPEPNEPPVVTTNLTLGDEGCYETSVTVGSTLTFSVFGNDANQEVITLSAAGQGFTLSSIGMNFPDISGMPTLTGSFNWQPECDALPEGVDSKDFKVFFYSSDKNICGQPTYDTACVVIHLLAKPDTNQAPVLTTNFTQDPVTLVYCDTIQAGDVLTIPFLGTDADIQQLALSFTGLNCNISDFSMALNPKEGIAPLNSTFTYKSSCKDLLDPEEPRTLELRFLLKDIDICGNEGAVDTVDIKIVITPVDNNPPVLTTSLTFDEINQVYCDTLTLGETFSFTALGIDPDVDSLLLSGSGIGFNMSDLGMSFPVVTGVGTVQGTFIWKTDCSLANTIEFGKPYELRFLVHDFKDCDNNLYDTVTVKLVVLPPNEENEDPIVFTDLEYIESLELYVDTVEVGGLIQFEVTGLDADLDSIFLTGQGVGFSFSNFNILWSDVAGIGEIHQMFRWKTDCNDLLNVNEPREFLLRFIIRDKKTCDFQSFDTAMVKLVLLPIQAENTPPKLSTDDLEYDPLLDLYTQTVIVGDYLTFDVLGEDLQFDSIRIWAEGQDFELSQYEMIFDEVSGYAPISGTFRWQTFCSFLGENPEETFQKDFYIDFYAKDYKSCQDDLYDTMHVKLTLKYLPSPNQPPVLTATLPYNAAEGYYYKEVTANDNLSFLLKSVDPNQNNVSIYALPQGFTLEEYNMLFEDAFGPSPLEAPFNWNPTCAYLGAYFSDRTFEILFVSVDLNHCDKIYSDTIKVVLTLTADPRNTPPVVTIEGLEFNATENCYTKDVFVNEEVIFDVVGNDADMDTVWLSAEPNGFTLSQYGMEFTPTFGLPEVRTDFKWIPDCSMLNGAAEKTFEIAFYASDRTQCGFTAESPVCVKLTLKDNAEIANYLPPNVFTPNGDGKNDTYRMPDLPLNTCTNAFEFIEIYNRWGKLVFKSEARDFEWEGTDFPAGVYYYTLQFTKKQYKGSISLLRD